MRKISPPLVLWSRRFGRRLEGLLIACVVAFTAAVLCAAWARADEAPAFRPSYVVRAALLLDPPRIEGTVEVEFTNTTDQVLDDAVFFAFPNRFAAADNDAGVNDFNRPFVYPEQQFDAGSMGVHSARDDGEDVPIARVSRPGLPAGAAFGVPIARLRPGESGRIELSFRTAVPQRFGSFGEFEGQITLDGGWYPYLAALGEGGTWELGAAPPLADFDVELTRPEAYEVILNGRHFAPGEPVQTAVPGVHYLSLVAAPEFERDEVLAAQTRLVVYRRPPRRAMRLSPEPPFDEILLASLREAIEARPPGVPAPPAELVVVEAPLRLRLTAGGEGAVLISDRAIKVHYLLRPFHEMELAQALYAEILRPTLAAREPSGDYPWVSGGMSRLFAERYFDGARAGVRGVRDWIELFNIFAIVDRFESEPRVPFVSAFFDQVREADPLHAEITTFNASQPPGHVVFDKLRALLGPARFDALLDDCATAEQPWVICAAMAAPERDIAGLLSEWVQPYPEINYSIDALDLNRPEHGRYRHSVSVRRESSRPFREPVTVRLRSLGGRQTDLQWNSGGDVAHMSALTDARLHQAVVDPERQLIERRRDDNAWPPTPQIVLDTAEVEISSTAFGLSGLVVARGRYDYRKDLAFAGFYTNRSVGFTSGGRLHWGTPIDATSFRHNLYGFYGFQALAKSFKEKGSGNARTTGQLASLGLRYDYTNIFYYDRPSRQRSLRLFADWYDKALGGDFDYVDWGFTGVATQPLGSPLTLGALQILNGFSEPLDGSRVPNQGLYSLGGSRSIRGIGAEESLAQNILVVRGELRHDIYPEVDLNLLDLLVLRRQQLRAFVDSGRVNDSTGRIYDVSHFAVGVGVGVAAVYDFMGFFPATAYFEVATRVDRRSELDDVQFLFGTRQSF